MWKSYFKTGLKPLAKSISIKALSIMKLVFHKVNLNLVPRTKSFR